MSDMLLKEDIMSKREKEKVAGLVYVQSYTDSVTKDGKPFFNGTCQGKGTIPFKVWSNSACFHDFQIGDFSNQIVYIEGTVDLFNGVGLCLTAIRVVDNCPLDIFDFFEERYDVHELTDSLFEIFSENCSPEAIQIFNLLTHDEMTRDVWREEFAAIGHHDAVRHGLLAHSMRVTKIMKTIADLYPSLHKAVDNDLLFVGSALHDIGKCLEYHNGGMSKDGAYVSHMSFGIILVSKYQKEIEEYKGHEFYMNLLSIVTQHHGAHGDTPKTLVAYLVHVADALEANLAKLEEVVGPMLGSGFHTLKTSAMETGEWTIRF